MDESLTFKKPDNITIEQAATMGVGLLVSLLALGAKHT
jgi:NADPH:quinone reductase-like Zn-dependent oxidoreductase